MTQKKSRTPSPTSALIYQTAPFNYHKVLDKLTTLDPIKTPLETKHSGNLIHTLTDYFIEKPKEDIERLLQIIILLNYIARHKEDYSRQVLDLEQLLYNFKFSFIDLVDFINSASSLPLFYKDIAEVITENFALLKSSEIRQASEFLKRSVVNDDAGINTNNLEMRHNMTMDLLDEDFEEFVARASKNFSSVSSEVYKNKINNDDQLHRIVKFMQNFPFVSLFSSNTLQQWYDTLVILATKFKEPRLQNDFVKYATAFVADANVEVSMNHKLFLLDSLNTHLPIKTKITLAEELSKVKTAQITEKLFEYNLIPGLCKRFQEQLDCIFKNQDVEITPEIMQSILHNPQLYNPKTVKDILCTDLSMAYTLKELNTFFDRLLQNKSLPTPAGYQYCSIAKTASIDTLHHALKAMMNLSYFESPWFDKNPKTLHFKITFESNKGLDKAFYCSISYLGLGKYQWFDPYLFSQGVDFKAGDLLSLAKYIFSKNVHENTSRFVVTQYSNECAQSAPITFSWPRPTPLRNPSPAIELTSKYKEEVATLRRPKSESNLKHKA